MRLVSKKYMVGRQVVGVIREKLVSETNQVTYLPIVSRVSKLMSKKLN